MTKHYTDSSVMSPLLNKEKSRLSLRLIFVIMAVALGSIYSLFSHCTKHNESYNIQEEPLFNQVQTWSARYTHSDFLSMFQVEPLLDVEVDPMYQSLWDTYFVNHDIRKDIVYKSDPYRSMELSNLFGPYIESGILRYDQRFYVKYAGDRVGYGLFANTTITKGKIVGIYSGVITISDDTDYVWSYPSEIQIPRVELDLLFPHISKRFESDTNSTDIHEYINIQLGIDSKFKGNWLRFVNHAEDPNCDIEYVPHRNRWFVIYVANRLIRESEEVTVNYGSAYWDSRL